MEPTQLAGQSSNTQSIRCASCGGLNPSHADWCGQCLTRFAAPTPPPPPPPPPPPVAAASAVVDEEPDLLFDSSPFSPSHPDAAEETAFVPAPSTAAENVVERGAFRASGDRITWTCTLCDQANPLEASHCTVCGADFAVTVRPKEPEGPIRDPNNAALVSLFFPGAGHAYLGLWGQAIARGVMSLWVAATALVAAITKGPNSGSLALTFGLASFVLWLVGAHDAYRDARREPAFVVLKGRRFLWLTLSLLAVLFLTLMMGLVGARTAAPAGPSF